jgi:endonuclease/exonuclease/phosphatase family metal-dependent hydrolase
VDRSAFAILPRDPDNPDIDDYAAALGLSVFYVPSMRNGPELREDRGNAIISTEPLLDPLALELPLARQRRVTLGAAIDVRTDDGVKRLELINAHFEPLSSPKTLWVFKNPRAAQARAILELIDQPRYTDRQRTAGTIVGGDFNTVRSGAAEPAIRLLRAWSTGPQREDSRNTHMMGRLDYLFFNLPKDWRASTQRLDTRFGSDHHPVLGTLSR